MKRHVKLFEMYKSSEKTPEIEKKLQRKKGMRSMFSSENPSAEELFDKTNEKIGPIFQLVAEIDFDLSWIIAIGVDEKLSEFRDYFEEIFYKNLAIDYSELGFDFIRFQRIEPWTIPELEEEAEAEYDSFEDALYDLEETGLLVFKGEEDAIELANIISEKEAENEADEDEDEDEDE
jgi:DNA mismatch repair ATPase MutS